MTHKRYIYFTVNDKRQTIHAISTFYYQCQINVSSVRIKRYCCNPLLEVIPALVEPVDPENVNVRQAVPLADGSRGVRDGSYGFQSINSKGSSTDLNNVNKTKDHSKMCFHNKIRFNADLFDLM